MMQPNDLLTVITQESITVTLALVPVGLEKKPVPVPLPQAQLENKSPLAWGRTPSITRHSRNMHSSGKTGKSHI